MGERARVGVGLRGGDAISTSAMKENHMQLINAAIATPYHHPVIPAAHRVPCHVNQAQARLLNECINAHESEGGLDIQQTQNQARTTIGIECGLI